MEALTETDILVLGSGIAGLTFALKASEYGAVSVVTKKEKAESSTNLAQGGIACVLSSEDSFDSHVNDTLRAGDGLCDERVVREIVREGPDRVRELLNLGVQFSQSKDGSFHLGREGGHSHRRVIHAEDLTGRAVETALLHAMANNKRITVYEDQIAVNLVVGWKENRCFGAYILDKETGSILPYSARVTVLATGGVGRVYLHTTNPDIATGDGVAMAYRAGATIANMEFIQFHPTMLFHPMANSFLISEAVRGEGAVLVDARGRAFMEPYHPSKSLAPRDVVARAIDNEMKMHGDECVHLDCCPGTTHKPPGFMRNRFPNIHEKCLSLGIDMDRDPIPVVPAAHYSCGGVKTNLFGESSVRNLLAIGEVACTGLHGANRLASNSLLEALVVGHNAAFKAGEIVRNEKEFRPIEAWNPGKARDTDEAVVVVHNLKEIRHLMWDYVGIVRSDKRLHRAKRRIANLNEEIKQYYWDFILTPDLVELRNIATVAELIVDSALSRKESRGLHYSLDYPDKCNEHLKDTVIEAPPRLR
jgi:L-aspartate oxidase